MAYTKTVWEDLPSEDTMMDADKLNNMEDGIEANDILVNFAVITTAPTATTNGDYKCTTTGVTLAAGQCYKMLFPAPTDGTKNARLSVDNGSNYKNILFFGCTTAVPSALLSGLNADLCYDGTNFYLKTPVSGTWTPTLSAGGSMTIESPTINEATYSIANGVCSFTTFCSFTTAGTQDASVRFTIPFAYKGNALTKNALAGTMYNNFASSGTMTRLTNISSKIVAEVRRYDSNAAGWGIGVNREFTVAGSYFLA